MYKYEYVTVKAKGFGGKGYSEHREVIDDYAKNGYKYVGYIPLKEPSLGISSFPIEIDLVFEIEVREK